MSGFFSYYYSLMIENNYIISQYNIKSDKKGQSVKIINSCFGEINELSCDLYLNNKKINFDFNYLLSKTGEYTFKIIFKILLKDISGMFCDCSSLTSLDLSNFKTNNVQNMSNMFSGCSSLTSLNLSNFNTNNVQNMYGMFSHCSSLTSLNTKDKKILKIWKNK